MLRFASAPIGDMYIDDLYIALLNYIVSQQKKEDLIVRIEDTDKKRDTEGGDKEILDILDLFEIQYSQVIYQSQNVRFHSAMALQLIHDKKAFSCFCSQKWLNKKQEEAKEVKKPYRYDDACANLPHELVIDNTNPFTIRVKKPEKSIVIKDYIKGKIIFKSEDMDSFIIMQQDKTPTSNFACAIDDMLSDISLVIRSEDYLNNTPKQEHIRKLLNYEKKVEYAHLPIILNENGKKMSKKDDAFSVKWLLEEGYLPSAISNYLISIGVEAPCEIFNAQEAVDWLDLKSISNSPARFSIELLKYINKEHLENLDALELSRYVGFADANIGNLAKVYLEDAQTTKELRGKIEPIFSEKKIPQEFKESVDLMIEIIKDAPYFEEYSDFKDYIMEKSGLKGDDFLKSLRFILTGASDGPDIAEIYKYLKNYIGEIVK